MANDDPSNASDIVHLAGDYDIARQDELRSELLSSDADVVVADLRDVSFLDSSAIHAFVDARNQLVSALADHALHNGIREYVGIAEARWFAKISGFGWSCRALGPALPGSAGPILAFGIRIDADTLPGLQRTGTWTPLGLKLDPLHLVSVDEAEPESTGQGFRKVFKISLQHFAVGDAVSGLTGVQDYASLSAEAVRALAALVRGPAPQACDWSTPAGRREWEKAVFSADAPLRRIVDERTTCATEAAAAIGALAPASSACSRHSPVLYLRRSLRQLST